MVQIRKAKLDDAESIRSICIGGWQDAYTGIVPQDYIDRMTAQFYTLEGIRNQIIHIQNWDGWIVADNNGKIVGTGGGGITSQPGQGEVYVLFVEPAHRGQGTGTALLQEITNLQKQQGAHEQRALVFKGNQKGLPFFQARGFVIKEEQPAPGSRQEEHIVSLVFTRTI